MDGQVEEIRSRRQVDVYRIIIRDASEENFISKPPINDVKSAAAQENAETATE